MLPSPNLDTGRASENDQLKIRIMVDDDLHGTTGKTIVSYEVVQIKKLLGPLTMYEVPTLRCVGLNYTRHIKVVGPTPPPVSFIFFKLQYQTGP